MKDTNIIIAVAKLDGKEPTLVTIDAMNNPVPKPYYWIHPDCNNYLTSRDAIIPVIEKNIKQSNTFCDFLLKEINGVIIAIHGDYEAFQILIATPKQLSIALLKATGKWTEE